MADFKKRMRSGERLVGTFVKTPAIEMIEVLGRSGLDFLCLDAEHSAFDRARMDACLALARAMDVPVLVRVGWGSAEAILQALDAGAVGVVVPHVDTPEKAADIARWAHFGVGGRGYAGSTRWAGFATRPMQEVLAQDAETVVIAQIEEPAGVEAVEAIATTPGIDGLFLGPADLSVAHGRSSVGGPELEAAYARVGAAARDAGLACMTFVPGPDAVPALAAQGVHMFFVASEHSWMLDAANTVAERVRQQG